MEPQLMQHFMRETTQFRGKPAKVRNIMTLFHTDEIPMLIFSYVWTSQQATKRIREINSKGKASIDKKAIFE
jgi:hypothetical protein